MIGEIMLTQVASFLRSLVVSHRSKHLLKTKGNITERVCLKYMYTIKLNSIIPFFFPGLDNET